MDDPVAAAVTSSTTPGCAKRAEVSIIRCRTSGQCDLPEKLDDGRVRVQTIATREAMLRWDSPIKTILVVKKLHDTESARIVMQIGTWLMKHYGITVCTLPSSTDPQKSSLQRYKAYMEPELADSVESFQILGVEQSVDNVDLIVAVGGDGTVLHISSLFCHSMPPVFSVAGGSLGFMTMFSPTEAKHHLARVLNGQKEPVSVSIRTRILVKIYKNVKNLEGEATIPPAESEFEEENNVRLRNSRQCLNELLIDRGQSPFLTTLDAFVDDEPLTAVQADGILVATPSGSTAYSLSAGGSICTSTVPALLFTPICPHSLSFRPVLFPDSSTIKLCVPNDARAAAFAHFDGKDSIKLQSGDCVVVSMSEWPMPLINKESTTKDWVNAITQKLNWNIREARQKALEAPTDP
eukprot:gb/GECG01016750.1/.p1 GENE.gb/GECG01016750.1/~~gb/GECG01016750.1/.p1  ORF type:complete len:408 (+),score=43.87 gb/GECG01016750.1/:1-1224(+)